MNTRLIYLLVAIGAIATLSGLGFSNAEPDSPDSSSDDSDGEHDNSHSHGHHHHQQASDSDSDHKNSVDPEADFSDSDEFSDLDVELTQKKDYNVIFGDANKKYERLFGAQSEPLSPGEALKILAELRDEYASAGKVYLGDNGSFELKLRSLGIQNLLAFDAISRNCKLTGKDMSWISVVYELNKRSPGLQHYLSNRRRRLFDSCATLFANNVHRYKEAATKDDSRGDAVFLKNALASVPDEFILEEEFLSTQNEQVSAALSDAYNFHYGGKSYRDKNQKHYKEKFLEYVWQFCGRLPSIEILPNGFLGLAFEAEIGKVLDRRVIDWLKVQRMCQQIQPNPNAAADIVFAYNESLRAQKRAAKQKRKGIGCFPAFGTKATPKE